MKKMLIVVCALALTSAFASAQVSKTLRAGGSQKVHAPQPSYCSPCLFYSGDFDPFNANANGLFNANAEAFGIVSQVYVPIAVAVETTVNAKGKVKAQKSASVTELIFNELASGTSDFTGATYDIRTDLGNGFGGTELANGHGTCSSASAVETGRTGFGFIEYTFTCTLSPAVTLKAGTEYWVNVLPTFTDGDYGYVSDSIDVPPLNGYNSGDGGLWGNVFEASYFESSYFGASWEEATTQAFGMDEFSIAVVGTY